MNTKKNLLASTIAFFMGSAVQGVVAQEDVGGQEENEWALEEIVVTATKREGALQDIPVSISVLSKDTIEKRGLVNMNDYLTTIPGASYIQVSATDKNVILRGLSTGPLDPQTVSSVYLGEMPLSSALNTFDINLVDIEQIEVVKGPQGTLYGSSALGGIVRNIPVAPSLNHTKGSIKIGSSSQSRSDDTNHSLSGFFNIPLIDNQMALRVVAYRFDHAGYVDIVSSPEATAVAESSGTNVVVKEDSGGSISTGARASLLWHPTDDLKISLVLGNQEDDVDGSNNVSVTSRDYQISYLNFEPSENVRTGYSNLLIEYDLGWAKLLSSSSILDNKGTRDSNPFPAFPDPFFGPTIADFDYNTDLKSQEIRLASNFSGPWQALAGLFYEDAQLKTREALLWPNSNPNPFGGELIVDLQTDLDYNQKAVFGEISYQFNEQWLLTLGGRHFKYDRIDTETYLNDGVLNGTNNEEDVSQSGNTYKANLSFTPTENTLIYAQWSEGFRIGRGQSLPPLDLCDTDNNGELDFGTGAILTTRVEPDTTENMEVGVKLSLFDNSLTVNTAFFRTDWDNLPVDIDDNSSVCPGPGRVTNNIGEALSQGLELEVNYQLNAWVVNVTASYIDTERKNVRSPLIEGEHLVYSPRTNASASLQYNFSIGSYSSFVRTDIGYVGEYESAPRWLGLATAGDYMDTSLRFGINVDNWHLAIYGSNLQNNNDLRVHSDGAGPNAIGVRAQPRRVGLELTYNF